MAKKSVDLTSLEWTNLIFEGKNKDFGAYQLRRKSDKRHNLAVLFTLIGLVIVALLVWALSVYNNWQAERAAAEAKAKQEQMMAAMLEQEKEQPEEEQPEEQKFEPEVPEVKEEVLQTVQVTQIAIVEKAAEDKKILSNEERTETQTTFGTHNQEGVDDPDKVKEAEKLVQVVHHEEPPKPVIEEKKEEPKPDKIFTAVEQQAQFPGGQAALMKWLNSNLRYPERAQQNDIQGRVIVKFVVNADGSIEQASVVKGVDKDLDNEAIRVVKRMPKWQPGKNNGVAVRSYFTLPVTFKLQK